MALSAWGRHERHVGGENPVEFIDPALIPSAGVRIAAFDGENADSANGPRILPEARSPTRSPARRAMTASGSRMRKALCPVPNPLPTCSGTASPNPARRIADLTAQDPEPARCQGPVNGPPDLSLQGDRKFATGVRQVRHLPCCRQKYVLSDGSVGVAVLACPSSKYLRHGGS